MGRFLAIVLVAAALVHSMAYKTVLAIAPPLVQDGDLPSDLQSPFQTVLAEILSWEASAVPSVRVVDPSGISTTLDSKGWNTRADLTESEVEDARMAARQQDASAVVVLQVVHSGTDVEWKAALAYRDGTVDKSTRIQGYSREDDFLLDIRRQSIAFLDSLGVEVPDVARQMAASDRGRVPWEALLDYSRGVRDQQSGHIEDALRNLREATRRAPFLPALQYRLKKLERDNPGK
jgi:hypothetical protein